MTNYVGKRLLQLIPILIGLTFLVFTLLYIAPGDPAQRKLTAQGVAVSEQVLEQTREEMGLNRPFLVRYGDWLLGVLRGDFGASYKDGMPVLPKLMRCMGNTLVLAAGSLLLALVVSVPLGVLTAARRGGVIDRLVRLLTFVGNAMPNFLVSVLLMYYLCIQVNLFPVIAKGTVQGLFLPALALAIPMASRFIRQIRAEVLEELGKPYVAGALARGVAMRTVLVHDVLRNTLSGVLTIVGLSVGTLMGGSVVVETIFRWPGVGQLVMDAISARDFPVIQGFVLLMAVIYVVVNLLTDLSYRALDPRVELE
ncbi:MAG: ABC transporter permease [Clostridiales bacterium]|nr:ABC transporter permease [Clostridiales bacterium]MDD6935509.1 ABC transporter permease [Clostridiales bacterium]MDY2961360.1 nickel ABC transporter permease [Oscillospiraceae bacterium]